MVPQCLQDTVSASYYALEHLVCAFPGCHLSLIYSWFCFIPWHHCSSLNIVDCGRARLSTLNAYNPSRSGWKQRRSCQDVVQALEPLGRLFCSHTIRGYTSISLCFQLLVIQRMVPRLVYQHHERACYKCRISGPIPDVLTQTLHIIEYPIWFVCTLKCGKHTG